MQERLIAVFPNVLTSTLYFSSVLAKTRLKQSATAFSYLPTFSVFSFQHILLLQKWMMNGLRISQIYVIDFYRVNQAFILGRIKQNIFSLLVKLNPGKLIDWRFDTIIKKHYIKKGNFSWRIFFRTCEQIRRNLWISSYLLNKLFMENFIFCAVQFSKLCFLGYIRIGSISGQIIKDTHTITIRLTFLHRKMAFCHLILKGFYPADSSSAVLIMLVWLGFQN